MLEQRQGSLGRSTMGDVDNNNTGMEKEIQPQYTHMQLIDTFYPHQPIYDI